MSTVGGLFVLATVEDVTMDEGLEVAGEKSRLGSLIEGAGDGEGNEASGDGDGVRSHKSLSSDPVGQSGIIGSPIEHAVVE